MNILSYYNVIVKYKALSLLYINKGVFFFDLLGIAHFFIQQKRDPPRYKPVLDLIGERTPSPPKIVLINREARYRLTKERKSVIMASL